MDELFEWLRRLDDITSQPGTEISEWMCRVVAPTALDFDESVLRVVDTHQEMNWLGRFPGKLAVLTRPDAPGRQMSLADQVLAAQLGAVLTLATNRRVQVAAADVPLTLEGTEQRIFLPTAIIDSSLNGELPVDTRDALEQALRLLVGLADRDRAVLGAATELHYTAVLLADVDPNAAYAVAIAGIERLSRAYGEVPTEWWFWDRSGEFDELFRALDLTDDQCHRLREAILRDQHLRLRQTFASYVVDALPAEFWNSHFEPYAPAIEIVDGQAHFRHMVAEKPVPITSLVPNEPDELRKRLLRSYDARSAYVHEGRRATGPAETLRELVATTDVGVGPVQFAGIRLILRTLIQHEAGKRANPAELPSIQWMHPGHRPSRHD